METTTLFDRLGSTEGIARIVDDVVAAHLANPVIGVRFAPYTEDPARLAEIKQHLCRFLAAGSGGPQEYAGRSMPDAHRGMNVSVAEYAAATDDIMEVLEKHDLDEGSRKDILFILYSLKSQIVEH